MDHGNIITSGGRVFGLTAWANNIENAIHKVYSNVGRIYFDGMQYRKDIAHRALSKTDPFTDSRKKKDHFQTEKAAY